MRRRKSEPQVRRARTRSRARASTRGESRKGQRERDGRDREDEEPELTRAQMRELRRRAKDAWDPTRYLVRSVILRRPLCAFYYDAERDAYCMGAEWATRFKRLAVAEAVRKVLGKRAELLRVRLVDGELPKRLRTEERRRRLESRRRRARRQR
ncbi:MAG: hypothetical protein HY721_16550 [Planctomycetes bacterium]|nr:hypothetical protein [Planctomycetota bacterium]